MQTTHNFRALGRRLAVTFFSLGAASALVGCLGAAPTPTATPNPTITLIQNPWTASKLNVAIAKILIEEQLHYPVTVIETSEQEEWELLAKSQAQAVLEVWPSSPQAEIQKYLSDDQLVEYGGPLGVNGKIGWYVPTYVVEDNPALAQWEAYQDPANTAAFRTAASGTHGQFLAGDPTWGQYDAAIIENLKLDLQVVVAGTETELLTQVDAAYQARQPILFYFWTPHALHAKYALTPVELPPFTNECYAKAETTGVACDYPTDKLFKVFAPDLYKYAPSVYEMLKLFSYDNPTQIALIAAVDNEGQTVEAAARAWVDSSQAVWQTWISTAPAP